MYHETGGFLEVVARVAFRSLSAVVVQNAQPVHTATILCKASELCSRYLCLDSRLYCELYIRSFYSYRNAKV